LPQLFQALWISLKIQLLILPARQGQQSEKRVLGTSRKSDCKKAIPAPLSFFFSIVPIDLLQLAT
jgi:hypothetical protein